MTKKFKKILVVDDEPGIRDLMFDSLEEEGYCILLASNGEIAITILNDNKFDLIVTDVHMPVMDGFDFILECKQNYDNIPIIAISGGSSNDAEAKSLKMIGRYGRLPILHKPFQMDELLKIIAEMEAESTK